MRKLEAYSAFPFIAWFLVIGFSYYVYTLTATLDEEVAFLGEQSIKTQAAVAGQ